MYTFNEAVRRRAVARLQTVGVTHSHSAPALHAPGGHGAQQPNPPTRAPTSQWQSANWSEVDPASMFPPSLLTSKKKSSGRPTARARRGHGQLRREVVRRRLAVQDARLHDRLPQLRHRRVGGPAGAGLAGEEAELRDGADVEGDDADGRGEAGEAHNHLTSARASSSRRDHSAELLYWLDSRG
jgi:hypothetical protein